MAEKSETEVKIVDAEKSSITSSLDSIIVNGAEAAVLTVTLKDAEDAAVIGEITDK